MPDLPTSRVARLEAVEDLAADPPNAALWILTATEPQGITMELTNPGVERSDLICDGKISQGGEMASGKTASLSIDPTGRPMSPTSIAGAHRRRRRRIIRSELL